MDLRHTCVLYEREHTCTDEKFVVSGINNAIIQELWVTVPANTDKNATFEITIGGQPMFRTSLKTLDVDRECLAILRPSKELIVKTDTSISINMLAFNEGFFPCIATIFHPLVVHVKGSPFTVKILGWDPYDYTHVAHFFQGQVSFPMVGWHDFQEEEWTTYQENLFWSGTKNVQVKGFVFQVLEGDITNVDKIQFNDKIAFDPHCWYRDDLHGYDLPFFVDDTTNFKVKCMYKDPTLPPLRVRVRMLVEQKLRTKDGVAFLSW